MGYWSDQSSFSRPHSDMSGSNPYGNFTLIDTVPKELMPWVDPHWYQYPPMNPLWYGLLGFAITVLGLLALSGNCIVIWVFMNTKPLRTPANLLIVNLALSDFLMMFTMFPPMVYNCFYGTWSFSGFFCELYGLFGNLCGCVSIWTMVFITFDRYNVIVKGVAGKPLSTGGSLARIAIVWVLSVGWCILPMFGWNRYVPEGNMTACGTDYLNQDFTSQLYLYIYGFWVYYLPLLLTIYCYTFIVRAVASHENQMREQAKKMGIKSLRNEETQKTSAECRLAKVALTTVSLWFIAWTPYMVINFTGLINKDKIDPLFTIWGSLFAKANAVYNPIVYAISHPKYRAALDKKLPCLACSKDDSVSDSCSATTTQSEAPEKSENA